MGQLSLFRCDRCGYNAELNLSQPDRGMMGSVEQFFCQTKEKIATIFLGFGVLEDALRNPVCYECAYDTNDEDCENIDKRKWDETHPECRMKNLQPLIIIADDENIAYHCPCKNCEGIMHNIGELIVNWD